MKIISILFILSQLIVGTLCFAADANETDPFDLPQIVALENKKFNPYRDVTVQLGVMPLDAFYKALTLGISYTQGFTSYLSWEIFNAHIASENDTDLKQDLLNLNVRPKGLLDSVKYYVTSNAVYTPIYSKNLLFNKDVIYADWSFIGGIGLVGYQSSETALMFGGGLMARFYKSTTVSYKLDTRFYYQTAPDKSSDFLLMVNLGMAFEFGSKTQAGRTL